ncbi:uncharacterized protein LOC113387866 [Ctenocephalides felis]|uniref:uncharacterized protein LOC113382614 n=1 Tax=Ctenocephalides felis TaxID=7515 RepID=UPI000E6E48FC|nr:uncharacterized protein LOC113382614 [Ctenocephalides felis]XP_026481039.1 uncharacterized protein LOC113387866 [Ctenocephalides felis]
MSSPLAVFGTVAAVGLGVVMLLVDMAIKYNRNSKRRNREHRQQRPSSPVQSERVARTPEDDNSRIVPLNREYHQERPSSPVRIERVAETLEDDNSRIVPLNREYHQERPSSPVRIERVAETLEDDNSRREIEALLNIIRNRSRSEDCVCCDLCLSLHPCTLNRVCNHIYHSSCISAAIEANSLICRACGDNFTPDDLANQEHMEMQLLYRI